MKNLNFKKSLITLPVLAMLTFGGKKADLEENPYIPIKKPVIEQSIDYNQNSKNLQNIVNSIKENEYLDNPKTYSKEFWDNLRDSLNVKTNDKKPFKIKKIFNYRKESNPKGIDYLKLRSRFNLENDMLEFMYDYDSILNNNQISELDNVIRDIKSQEIDSYEEFIQKTQNFSENQKLVLVNILGDLLVEKGYGLKYEYANQPPQSKLFNRIQYFLQTGNDSPFGVCKQISTAEEIILEDMNIPADTIGAYTHQYTIAKTSDGISILDYGFLLNTNTKNIERALEMYDFEKGNIIFQREFYDKGKPKYIDETTDGKHFIDFIGYDKSINPLKKSLGHDKDLDNDLEMVVNQGDFENSMKFNYHGFFVKGGDIKGSKFSSMDKAEIGQVGFRRNFLIFDSLKMKTDLNFIGGKIYSKNSPEVLDFNGINTNSILATKEKKGFNISTRFAGSLNGDIKEFCKTGGPILFWDANTGTGISYTFPIKNINIKPYILTKSNLFIKDLDNSKFEIMVSEKGGGTDINLKISDNINLSIDPHYLKKMWEKEYGFNTTFNSKYFGLNIGAKKSKSTYEFNPDKKELDLGVSTTIKDFNLNANYKIEQKNYDDEKENQHFFEFKISNRV